MGRFILTGAPGAGKTAIPRELEREGFSVVEEAATDVIAEMRAEGLVQPWTDSSFLDRIVWVQRDRQVCASNRSEDVQFHDRSAVCTAALAVYLGYSYPPSLVSELGRIRTESIYERRVFFVRNLGFVAPTEARRISFEDTVRLK